MFPRNFIDDMLVSYTLDEKESILKDKATLQGLSFDIAKPTDNLVYTATAGGPGAAKTTTLETYIARHHLQESVYADPDQVALINMNYTYRRSINSLAIAKAVSKHAALKNGYEKWRSASNYICHEMLQIAFGGDDGKQPKYSVNHGTTSTSPFVEELYKKIKALGYQIHLLLCYSEDQTRKQMIEVRESQLGIVQVDPAEVISKGASFCERFNVYFKYADELECYWNNELTHGKLPQPCAKFRRLNGTLTLEVFNQQEWNSFCQKYVADLSTNQKALMSTELEPFLSLPKKQEASALQAQGKFRSYPVSAWDRPASTLVSSILNRMG